MKVKELLHHNLETVGPETNALEIAKKMSSSNIGAIPVVEKDKVVGIITDRDIALRVTAKQKEPSKINASSIMSKNVKMCSEDDDIKKCANLMEENQIGRILVVNKSQAPKGIISVRDLASNPKCRDLAVQVMSNKTKQKQKQTV